MRPRPSDDPVMNTRATLALLLCRAIGLRARNALPAPRVFPFTLCAARRRRAAFYGSNNFVRTSSNDAYRRADPGPFSPHSPGRTGRNLRPGQQTTSFAYSCSVTLTVWRRVSHRALQCGQRACAAQSPRRHGSGEHRCSGSAKHSRASMRSASSSPASSPNWRRPSVCSRATARERKQERRSQARPRRRRHRRPLQRGKARIGALRSQNQLASDGARRA